MKTIYLDRAERVDLTDVLADFVDAAVQKVHSLAAEDEKWRPYIDIPLKHWSANETDLVIKVGIYTEDQDSAPERLHRCLVAETPDNFITVQLGRYDDDGWENQLSFNDVRELPNIYFSDHLLDSLTDDLAIKVPYLDNIRPEHQQAFAMKLYGSVVYRMKDLENESTEHPDLDMMVANNQEREYLYSLASAIKTFYRDNASFDVVKHVILEREVAFVDDDDSDDSEDY